jgi:arabinofuranan 3-O-arabinosyltransferase
VRFDPRTGITGVEVVTDNGSEVLPVRDDQINLPGVTTARLRLVITSVAGTPTTQRAAGVRAVRIPHVDVGRTVVLPANPWPSGPDRVVLSADPGQGSCIFLGARPLCAPTQARTGEDAGGLDRSFTLPTALRGTVAVTARPVPDGRVTRAVEKALGLGVVTTASSVEMPDLAAGPLSAADGDIGTAWVASPRDPDPSLTLSWDRRREVSSVQVLVDPYAALTRPTRVRITAAGGQERTAEIDSTGVARFAPLRTQRMTVHRTGATLATSLDAYTLEPSLLGVGVSELLVPGVTPRITVDRPALARTVSLPCGQGPRLEVAGQQIETRVTTTVGELLRSIPVAAEPCSVTHDGPVEVRLPAGAVQVHAGTPDRWDVEAVVITRTGMTPPANPDLTTPVVRTWDDTHRTVAVGERSVPSLLVVNENANLGWRATLAGRTLASTEVDGWQQGYVLPAGRAGTVRLDFTPDTPVRWGMALGAFLVLGLVAMALLPERRRHGVIEPAGGRGRRAVAVVVGGCVALVAGGWGLLVLAAVAAVSAVAARLLSRDTLARASVVATVLSALAAGAVLVSGHYASQTYRADRPVAQLLVVAVLSVLAVSVWAAARHRAEPPVPLADGSDGPAGSAAAPGTGS